MKEAKAAFPGESWPNTFRVKEKLDGEWGG